MAFLFFLHCQQQSQFMLLIRKNLFLFALSLLILPAIYAQKAVVTGKVTDNAGRPVPFVSVRIKSAQTGTSTDSLGAFSLRVGSGDSLVISAVGFDDTTVLAGSRTTLAIVLLQRAGSLHEALVSGSPSAGNTSDNPEAVKEEVIASTFQDWIRTAQFSNGQIQGSFITPGAGGGMNMVAVSTNGFGALNTLNQGTMLPVLKHQEDTRGSRYLLKDFAHGLIVDNAGKLIADSLNLMNYDKIDGQLMIAQDARNYLEVDKDKVVAFALKTPDTAFVFLNVPALSKSNYFLLIANGPRYSIYKSVHTKFIKANYVSNGLTESGNNYDEYLDTQTYFWVAAKGTAGVLQLKKKSIREVFAAEKSKLDDFFAHHKYDDIDDAFLKKLIFYLNQ